MNRKYELIVIGGSAGSLQVILKLFRKINAVLPAAYLLVLHRNNNFDSSLEALLSFKVKLTVKEIEEKEKIEPGNIYVCPADYHVLVENDHSFSFEYSEKVNYSRPSIDVVFKSAADVYKDKMICILLSGANADGAEGIRYAQQKGALTIIQNPEEAEVAYMPEKALELMTPDYILKSTEMDGFINSLQ